MPVDEAGDASRSDPESGFRAQLQRDPFSVPALLGLGGALLRRGRPAEAAALLQTAAKSEPSVATLSLTGEAFLRAGLMEEAETWLRQALEVDDSHLASAVLLAELYRSTDRLDDAATAISNGQSHHPAADALIREKAALFISKGNGLYHAGLMAAAEASYREAIGVAPRLAGAHMNLANALARQLRLDDAMAAYDAALAIDPADDAARFARSLLLLLTGDLAEGFRLYEHRKHVFELRHNFTKRPQLPAWQAGQSVAGRRLLVTSEQGAGDVIQFVRFLPALAAIAASVVLEAPWPMHGIFSDLPGVSRVVGVEDPIGDCDLTIPVMSLPLLLGTEAGAVPPYIRPQEDRVWRWQAWLNRSPPGRRIGLVCSGATTHQRDRERSIPLATFEPLLALPDATFVLVQPHANAEDWAVLDDADNIRFPGAALTDWADTAALLSQLDLLITTDTAAAHLAGAMGLPVWTLLTFYPDWRWLLEREDSPWYPSMRLYRQPAPGDWKTVIAQIGKDLKTQQ